MFGLSNGVLALLNFFTIFVSLDGQTERDKFFLLPIFVLGMYFIVASFLGLIGLGCQATTLLKCYLSMIVFSMIGSLELAIFALYGCGKWKREGMAAFVFNNQYRLDKISGSRAKSWVMNNRNWATVKSCLLRVQETYVKKILSPLSLSLKALSRLSPLPRICDVKRRGNSSSHPYDQRSSRSVHRGCSTSSGSIGGL